METKYQLPAKFGNKLERRGFWAKIFADQIASGLSAKKFCKLHQLTYSTYKGNKYRAKYRANAKAKLKNKISNMQHNNHAAKFLPLQITPSNATSQKPCPAIIDQYKPLAAISNIAPEIQIIFKNDHRLILPTTTPETQLLTIINSIAGLLC